MTLEYVHPNNRLVEFRVGTLRNIVVQMFLVSENVHPLENEFEKRLQVFWAWRGNKNVGVTMCEGSRNGKTQCS